MTAATPSLPLPVAPSRVDEKPGAAAPSASGSFWEIIRDSYLVFDRRTLGLTRICLGFYLIMDLLRRTPDWLTMFGDRGVLPTTLILSRPQADNFSLLHG